MKKYDLVIITLLGFVCHFCATPNYSTPSESPGAVLYFGQGGGFTGLVTEFALLPNGQVFKKEGLKADFTALKKIDKKEASQAFSNYEHLGLKKMKVNSPGNLYFFIRYQDKEEMHELVWGGGKDAVGKEVKLYYKLLNRFVKPPQKEK